MSTASQNSTIDPVTLRAYHDTEYRVVAGTPFELRIGEHSAPLAELYAARDVTCSAFITACNPQGTLLSAPENAQRLAALADDLEESGYAVLPGFGADPTGDWPGEPSFLVLDIGATAARSLGHQFGQNAVVWAGPDAVQQLLLLR